MKKLFIDMDGVLCDYFTAYKEGLKNNPKQVYPKAQTGFFLFLEPMPDAIETVIYLNDY